MSRTLTANAGADGKSRNAWHNARPRERSARAPASFIDPCLPTKVDKPPAGNDWAHEIKHDGYRLQIHAGSGGVRLFTMSGYDWTDRYPGIVAAAASQERDGDGCRGGHSGPGRHYRL